MAERPEEPGTGSEAASEEEEGSTASSSSGDDDEKQPLAKRASWASQHALPQPAAPRAEARTRVNRFPKIPRSERCGSCENCLNPQRKKACIVARQRMEHRLKSQQGTLARSGTTKKPTVIAASAMSIPAKGPVPTVDPFTRCLTGILSSSGGVMQDHHLALLLQLVKRAKTKPHRTALLVVLQLSSPNILRQAVAAKLLLELQLWLSEFIAEGRQALVQKTLACLHKLPVTLAALQPPCELGKIVGRLRKHESFGSPVIEPAKRLVVRWKAMVEQSAKSASTTASMGAPAPPAANASVAAPPLETQPSASLSVTEDGDLFKGTDKQRTGVKDGVALSKKVATIKANAVEATRSMASESSIVPGCSPRAPGAAKQEPAASGKPSSSGSLTGQTDVGKVSASPFASLGSLGSGVTMLGGSLSSGLSMLSTVGASSGTAKERAVAAARRVPSPEPQPRKEKKKKVTWQDEEAMVGVRWFRKDEPPAAAHQDVDITQLPSTATTPAAAHEASPPGFESAAKEEHLSEAAALRRHRAEEDQERLALEQRLAQMLPTIAWMNPAENDAMSEAELASMPAPPARGEDSIEATEAAARRQQVPAALYAQLSALPDSPVEPSVTADHGQVQHLVTIARIPLSLEAAAGMQQQQQQQQAPLLGASSTAQRSGHVQQQQARHRRASEEHTAAVLPDIGAALAQLAASGILGAVAGSAAGSSASQQQQPSAMPRPLHIWPPGQQQGVAPDPGLQAPSHNWHAGAGRPDTGLQQTSQPPPARHPYSQRPCRYFNTPQGCYMGDRCNFAHSTVPSSEHGRNSSNSKRPAEDNKAWHHQASFKRGRI